MPPAFRIDKSEALAESVAAGMSSSTRTQQPSRENPFVGTHLHAVVMQKRRRAGMTSVCLHDAGGRRAALAAVANGTMDKFDWRIGHSPTDFDRWVNTSSSYEIDYVNGFEPWGILRRCDCAPVVAGAVP